LATFSLKQLIKAVVLRSRVRISQFLQLKRVSREGTEWRDSHAKIAKKTKGKEIRN
jgi:hypothetical protein